MARVPLLLPLIFAAAPAMADISPAANACIDALMSSGRASGPGGTVLGDEFSEAGSLVTLRDGGGRTWRCIAYRDGAIGELSPVGVADDVQGAMAGPVVSGTHRVQFAPGSSGTAMTATLSPGSSVRYVLGAGKGQTMNVDVGSHGGALDYRIYNPDGSLLLGLIGSDRPYQGQLFQSGDHVIEVVNAGAQPVEFDIGIGIR